MIFHPYVCILINVEWCGLSIGGGICEFTHPHIYASMYVYTYMYVCVSRLNFELISFFKLIFSSSFSEILLDVDYFM